jgi:hypothetical protein
MLSKELPPPEGDAELLRQFQIETARYQQDADEAHKASWLGLPVNLAKLAIFGASAIVKGVAEDFRGGRRGE